MDLVRDSLKSFFQSIRRLTLNQKILVSVMPFLIVVITIMGILNYLAAQKQILAGVQREMDILARQAADNLSSFFNQRRSDSLIVADAPILQDYLKNLAYGLQQEASAYRTELGHYYARFAQRAGVYSRIGYWNRAQREVAAAGAAGPVPVLEEKKTYLPSTIKPGEVRYTGLSPDNESFMEYYIGVFDDLGAFQGHVVLTCDLAHVRRLLYAGRVGEAGRALLVDAQGREFLAMKAPFANAITASAAIKGMPWTVKLTAKPEEFLEPLQRVQWTMATIFLVTGGLVLVWIWYWVRSTVRPIAAMAEGTKRLAAGDLDYLFDPPPTRELRILGDAFNDMSRSLKERNRELENRIRLLTALRHMDAAVIQRLDEESILRACLKAVAEGLLFDRTALYWVDTAKKEIAGRYVYGTEAMGLTEQAFKSRRVALGENDILNEAVKTRTAFLIKEAEGDPRVNPNYVKESKTREFVVAPICGKDRVFGVFTADNCYTGRPLEESDKEGLTLFAGAVGLALENADLFQHLAESEARYRTVLENSPVAVLGLSREHWITTWNRGAEQIFGYAANEIVGKPLVALFPQGMGEETKKLMAEVMEKGAVRDYSIKGIARGGRLLDLSLSWGGAHPDFWMNQEWAVVIRDVTEARKMQYQLIRSEKLSAVGQLISGIAHELNNPLQAVVGYAQLLWEDIRGMSYGDDMRQIYENALRCRKIIDNLLLFVRQGEVKKRPVKVGDAIKASLELLSHKLRKTSSVRVETVIPPRLPRVKADFQQIQQVFVNLINNACDAMAGLDGGHELKIQAIPTGDRVRIEFSDTGPGVPEEIRERIFEPFFTTKTEGHGTGLGLPVCRQIMEDHGGRIGFESRNGQGTTFWLELPVTKEREARAGDEPAELPRVPGKLVLIVDDEPTVLSFLKKVVEGEGDVVEVAATLHEAITKISQMPFDLVITDVGLGKETGLDLYEGWNRWTLQMRPPFIFITGDILNTSIDQIVQKKGLVLMHKPLDLESFQHMVRTQLSGLHVAKRPRQGPAPA